MSSEHALLRQVTGAALRHHREQLGLGLDDAARLLKCDRSKVSRLETGQRGIRRDDLDLLLDEYAIRGPERDTLVALTPGRGRSGCWHQQFGDRLRAGFGDYLVLESLASAIAVYSPLLVPDLLQTPGYARVIAEAGAGPAIPGATDAAVLITRARQQAILDGGRAEVTVVLGEAALRQQPGGDPQVMREQITRLSALAGSAPAVSIQIVPFTATVHPCLGSGTITVLSFAAAPYLDTVHIGGPAGGTCLPGRDHAARYAEALAQARITALTPRESARLLTAMTA